MSFRPPHPSLRAFAIASLSIALSLWMMAPAGGDVVVAQNTQRQCESEGAYRTLDQAILLGGEVKSEIFFRVHDCPKIMGPPVIYAVVVLDFARTLSSRDVDDMTRSANTLLNSLDKSSPSRSKFAVVAFNGRQTKTCDFSSDAQTLRSCTGLQPVAWPATDLEKALDQASGLFKPKDIPYGARKAIILFSDAAEAEGGACPRTAGRGDGKMVITVGVGNDPNESCLRSIASSNDLYFPGTAQMHKVREAALDKVENELESVIITNTIAANMQYVDHSAEPPVDKKYWDGDEYVLIWKDPWKNTIPPENGMKLSFTVRPHHAGGSQPISKKIVGSYAETIGKGGSIPFDIPRVAVMGPEQTTPTAPPTPAPTEIPPTEAPVEPSATSAPTEDVSRTVHTLHLPLLQKSEFCPRCPNQNRHDPFRP